MGLRTSKAWLLLAAIQLFCGGLLITTSLTGAFHASLLYGKTSITMLIPAAGALTGSLQTLWDAVNREVDEWVKENCTRYLRREQCWSHWFNVFSSKKILKCEYHTPLIKAYFELESKRKIFIIDHPFALERRK